MINIKSSLLGSALAVAVSAAPAMAADFHALKGLQEATPASLNDQALAATEGGVACTFALATTEPAGGVCLLAMLPTFAFFSVANAAPVTAAQYLQVHGLVPPTPETPPTPTP